MTNPPSDPAAEAVSALREALVRRIEESLNMPPRARYVRLADALIAAEDRHG